MVTRIKDWEYCVPRDVPPSMLAACSLLLAGAALAAWATHSGAAAAVWKGAQFVALIAPRLVRSGLAVTLITCDYLLVGWRWKEAADATKQIKLKECHERCARRLVALAFSNRGVYIKFAQHTAQMDNMLPKEYTVYMQQHVLNACPVSDFAAVRRTIEGQLGAPLDTLFTSFEGEPIASASLAQVHKATLKGGTQVAVKVQHPWVKAAAPADLKVIKLLVQAVRRVFPAHDFMWIVEEGERYLPEELDFKHEAANMARCRANLDSPKSRVGKRVYIPTVYQQHTTDRVLTMEFVHGCPVAEPDKLRQWHIDPRDVARLVAQVFTEMVFVHGDVHADPHAANMLVLKHSDHGHAILVLLDHGLYRQISDDFRLHYAEFWHALVFQDIERLKKHAQAMNAGNLTEIFTAMITKKPWKQVAGKRSTQAGSVSQPEQPQRGPHEARAGAELKPEPASTASAHLHSHAVPGLAAEDTDPFCEVDSSSVTASGHAGPRAAAPERAHEKPLSSGGMTKAEVQQRLEEVTHLLRSVPRDLLLLLRTDDCLRSLEHRLGVPLNTVATTARTCTRARHLAPAGKRQQRQLRLGDRASTAADRAGVELRIMFMSALVRWKRWRGQDMQSALGAVR